MDDLTDDFAEREVDETAEPSTQDGDGPAGLFAGDRGELSLDCRRLFLQLLHGPYIDGQRYTKLWSCLLQDERLIRSRLAELFLDIVIDRDQQIAFVRQAQCEGVEVPILLRRFAVTFIDSALILYLRRVLAQADARMERAVVSRSELNEHLIVYERASNTDRAGFAKRVNAAIEKMKKHNLLQGIRTSEDRFVVSPTLKLVFSASEIQTLTKIYNDLAAGKGLAASDPDEDKDFSDTEVESVVEL